MPTGSSPAAPAQCSRSQPCFHQWPATQQRINLNYAWEQHGQGATSCTAAQARAGGCPLRVAWQPLLAALALRSAAHLQGALVCAKVASVQVQQAAVGGSHRLLCHVQSAVAVVGCLADQQRGKGLCERAAGGQRGSGAWLGCT